MTPEQLRRDANAAAQEALRASIEYHIRHGHRSLLLEARYEAAERMVDAVDAYDAADTAAADAVDEWQTAVLAYSVESGESHDPLPDIALAAITPDLGDIHVYPAGVGR